MIETAISYFEAGLCVLPANLSSKRPALSSWSEFRTRMPEDGEIRSWFAGAEAICIVTGPVSGNLEILDFDLQGELFDAWRALVDNEMPGLFDRLVIERSQSGGRHVVYRSEVEIPGNLKLAKRKYTYDSDEEVTIAGKTYRPRQVGDHYEVTLTLIETRGDGGLFLCAPSPGYELVQESFIEIPILTAEEREVLIEAACFLTEVPPPEPVETIVSLETDQGRPGDDYNRRGDVRALLRQHGWRHARSDGGSEYWRRPGKATGWSASLRNGLFHVFSTNADPFDSERSYRPFSLYALLEHDGDFSAAASALRQEGFGLAGVHPDVDLSGLMRSNPTPGIAPEVVYPDPGPIPDQLLRIPGFVGDVMDHTLATAPYPNVALAFCGALSLQAVLAGRKVRDEGDNRTNLYILALAHSAAGKDHPRKVNVRIMQRIGLTNAAGDKVASGEGIQDALFQNPAMLFQTDELDGLLQSINKSRDARHESVMTTLLQMYSSANSVFPMRRKAGRENPGSIDQPCLVLFGTAIPRHFYEALSGRMLTNGFFARMLVVESGPRRAGQEPRIVDPPESVIETALWWSQFNPGGGNLESEFPHPMIVPADDEARALLAQARTICDGEYSQAEARKDEVSMTVWGRVAEQIRKLALLYAVSADHQNPRIDAPAVRWATAFLMHQARRMLFMAHDHVAETPFHAESLKLLRKLREAPGGQMTHSNLLRRMKLDARTFAELISTLEQQGDIEVVTAETSGRTNRTYLLKSGSGPSTGGAS